MTREEALKIVRDTAKQHYPDSLVDAFVKLGVLKLDDEPLKENGTFGGRIAAARNRAGLTQVGLAERLFISPQAVSGWERNETLPEVSRVVDLADALGISLDDLLRKSK